MRINDILYYSNRIEIERKNESKTMVFGLLFSLFLLIFFSFFLSFMLMIENAINSNEQLLALDVSGDTSTIIQTDYKEFVEESYTYSILNSKLNVIYGSSEFDPIREEAAIITIDGVNYKYGGQNSNNQDDWDVSLSVQCYNNNTYLNTEADYLCKNDLGAVAICGNVELINSGEIVVSNRFLDKLGINDYSFVLGKNISVLNKFPVFSYTIKIKNGNDLIDKTDDFEDYSYYFFEDYKIIGVFNSNIYNCPSRKNRYSDFWTNDKSINTIYRDAEYRYDSDLDAYFSVYGVKVYDADVCNKLESKGSINVIVDAKYPLENKTVFQFSNMKSTYSVLKELEDLNKFGNGFVLNSDLYAYFILYPFFYFSSIFIICISVCVMLLVILNIIRILDYSIKKNSKYYSLLYIMGLEYKNVSLIYIIRTLKIYLKSIMWISILSIPIIAVLKTLLNYIYNKSFNGILSFNMPIWIFVVDMLIVFIAVLIILLLTSFLIVLISRKKIVESKVN